MRAFIFVERFHLGRKWAYKANNEKMEVLTNRLEAVRKEYTKSSMKRMYGPTWQKLTDDSHSEDESDNELLDKEGVMDESVLELKYNKELLETMTMSVLSLQKVPVVSYKSLLNGLSEEIKSNDLLLDNEQKLVEIEVRKTLIKLMFDNLKSNRESLYNK
jgi:hypothetical protein